MAEPVLQRLFDSPLIEARLASHADADDLSSVAATVVTLANRFTSDIGRAGTRDHDWRVETSIGVCGRVEARGASWTAILCCDNTRPGSLLIEDPRATALSALHPGVAFAEPGEGAPPLVQTIAGSAGTLHLVPAFLRLEITGDARWAIVHLYARRS